MLLETDLTGRTVDKVKTAIERLRTFEPEEGYYLAFSGGKDSVVIKALAEMAGVKFDAHYNATTVDPPELVRFIKEYHPDVEIVKPEIPMVKLIAKKKLPPTRIARYCCAYYKESASEGRVTMTGARWAESNARKNSQGLITVFNGRKAKDAAEENGAWYRQTKKGGIVMNNDDSPTRRTVEMCYRTNKTLVNPIVDWTDDEVWQFIRENQIPYCKLYDEGWKRLGCIGCPMGGRKNMEREFERWPAVKKLYLRAFEDMIESRKRAGLPTTKFHTAQDVMDWWIEKKGRESDGQIGMEMVELEAEVLEGLTREMQNENQ